MKNRLLRTILTNQVTIMKQLLFSLDGKTTSELEERIKKTKELLGPEGSFNPRTGKWE